jgi:hypothetical protein
MAGGHYQEAARASRFSPGLTSGAWPICAWLRALRAPVLRGLHRAPAGAGGAGERRDAVPLIVAALTDAELAGLLATVAISAWPLGRWRATPSTVTAPSRPARR